jgi:hypothetical protein
MHLDTEIDEGNEAYTTDISIDHPCESQCIVDAMSKNWDEKSKYGCSA